MLQRATLYTGALVQVPRKVWLGEVVVRRLAHAVCAQNSPSGLFLCHTWVVRLKQESLQRALPLALLSLAVIAVPLLVWSPQGLPRLERLKQERAQLRDKAARLSEEIRELQAEVARVKSDPSHVEQVARDELGLVRQTEVVFQFSR